MAKIVKSAVRFSFKNDIEVVIAAPRHADAYELAFKRFGAGIPAEEGFITSTNRFVDRYEARYIAWEADQIIDPNGPLYSEDIWPED